VSDANSLCISLEKRSSLFMNAPCNLNKHYICKFSEPISLPTTTNPPASSCFCCPNGYEMYRGFCYKVRMAKYTSFTSMNKWANRFQLFLVMHRPGKNFEDARSICQQDGGDLASIHSRDENAYIEG
jgi:hypothetical protein